MSKTIRVIENAQVPENKQARELLDYAKQVHKFGKFDQADFIKLLKDQKDKNTALKNSKADPSLTWNYYRPGLWYYGFIEMYDGETKLTPKLGSIDPFKRTRKAGTPSKPKSLKDELAMLEARVEADMKRMDDIQEILEKAAAAGNGGATLMTDEGEVLAEVDPTTTSEASAESTDEGEELKE
jgi:hypothetical protein